jgi:Multicopper oxidase
MRAIPQEACSDNDSTDNIKGIVYYGDSASTPTTTGYTYTDSCDDENLSDLVPYLSQSASSTYLQVYNNDTTFTNYSGVVELPEANAWSYVLIETALSVPHPIHLHGHDFYILAQGTGTYNSSDIGTLTDPPRRDVAILPGSGYLVVAFKTDNPGAWLMHCHIGWHTEEGFAIQFLERYDEARKLIDYDTLNSTCEAWDAYVDENSVEQDDDDGI